MVAYLNEFVTLLAWFKIKFDENYKKNEFFLLFFVKNTKKP